MNIRALIWVGLCLLMSVRSVDPHLPSHVIPLHGNTTFGYYYANIFVGSPPQQQSVIIDTGSGILALPCSKCLRCGRDHLQPPLDVVKSSSNRIVTCESEQEMCQSSCKGKKNANPCTFLISYAEGSSLSGIVIEDEIQFERDSQGQSIKATFGCTTKETNLFYTQAANGIFGLAPKRKSKLLEQHFKKHSPFTGQELMFSICLARNGGQLTVGRKRQKRSTLAPQVRVAEQNSAQSEQQESSQVPLIKVAYRSHRNQYSLQSVGHITVNESKVRTNQDLGYYGMFLDTGSTFTYFPHKFYNRLVTQLENSCAYQPDRCRLAQGSKSACFRIQTEQDQTIKQALMTVFPPIEFQLGDSVIKWQPEEYFLLRSLRNKEICLGVDPLDRFLLGSNWMVNREIVFRLDRFEIQIYNNVSCGNGADTQELSFYTGITKNESPLQYIQAVVKSHEDQIAQVLLIILACILLLLGAIVVSRIMCKGAKKVPRKKGHRQLPEQEITKEQEGESFQQKQKIQISSSELNKPRQINQEEDLQSDRSERKSDIILMSEQGSPHN